LDDSDEDDDDSFMLGPSKKSIKKVEKVVPKKVEKVVPKKVVVKKEEPKVLEKPKEDSEDNNDND